MLSEEGAPAFSPSGETRVEAPLFYIGARLNVSATNSDSALNR